MRSKSSPNPRSLLADISHLLFPKKCLSCEGELTQNEQSICSLCTQNFTETNFHLDTEPTILDKLFWGRVSIHHTYALFFFEKEKTAQKILFQLKYRHNKLVGDHFGRKIAERLKLHPGFHDVDAYLPVPLHPKKEFTRGYNQSEVLAKGICATLNATMDTTSVRRVEHGLSQTRKSRFERWDSIQTTFVVDDKILSYQHVVLVDDVVTTGSTLEVIARAILEKHPAVKVSVVTLAMT